MLNRIRILTVTLAAATTAALACAPRTAANRRSTTELRQEIQAVLDHGARSWTRGDLDEFMRDYMPGESTTYVTSKGLIHGPAAIRERYAPRFAAGATHDSLSFEGLEIDPLAPDVVHVVAWYVLSRGDSVVARGPTSLVMVRDAGGRFRIVHDHSS